MKILSEFEVYGHVIGRSKRCCPACAIFLRILTEGSKEDFVVRGNFGTVTACSLPPWTPSHIVDSMNEIFGLTLRKDLVTFMAANRLLRGSIYVDSDDGFGPLIPQSLFDTL